ncbi:MAG TPA: DedA family protein [Terriglobales bacterium]|nr:DedA family protein [Terriglobales bacterium]
MSAAFLHFQYFFQHYGLLAVFVVLLLENFGLPLPGELVLLYAGYHLRVYGGFGFLDLLFTATLASVAGQTVGYGVGRYGRSWALRVFPLAPNHEARFSVYFARHGLLTIFVARFVAGLRAFAGLLAGLSSMAWYPFLAANVLGALCWVAAVGGTGLLLGAHWRSLVALVGRLDVAILALAVAAIALAWYRLRKEPHG